ncbi:MAG: phospho-sugar mutase [Spirochaetia bacterium]
MNPQAQSNFKNYIKNEKHPVFLEEAHSFVDNSTEIQERFSSSLEFGTGGLRGLIGAGYNRINPYIIARSSQGLATYTKRIVKDTPISAVISYDSRQYSWDFACQAAMVFAANGIRTYLFSRLHPVPLLSFAVRHYKSTFGIMITASHNPPDYNGYKVYWEDGAQVLPPHDLGIIKEIEQTQCAQSMPFEKAKEAGLIIEINDEIDIIYQEAIASLILRSDLIKSLYDTFSIVYTPLHGAGFIPICEALNRHKFRSYIVESQADPNGLFPTVKSPNPEDPTALKQAIDLAKEHGSQLVLATDPDADRLGVAVLHQQNYLVLSGNQIGAIILDYLAARHKEMGSLPTKSFFVNSIVSSPLQNAIARSYGIKDFRVLTGFKYTAEKIHYFEQADPENYFLFGCEESYGFLCTSIVRDKDAVSAALLLAECALWNHAQQRTLIDCLNNLYHKFGYFEEAQVSVDFPGNRGKATMAKLMLKLREANQNLFHQKILHMIDYMQENELVKLPLSNVLEFQLADGSRVIARPSGTEPKIKFYILGKGKNQHTLSGSIQNIKEDIQKIMIDFL